MVPHHSAAVVRVQMHAPLPPSLLCCSKVGKAYFALLDVLCHNHANVIATRDTSEYFGTLVDGTGVGCLAFPPAWVRVWLWLRVWHVTWFVHRPAEPAGAAVP